MKKLLLWSLGYILPFSLANAQVGINTETPQSALDVNGSIQLRNELQINGTPGTAGQVYFSQGNAAVNDWKNVNVPFLEDGQYQLVNTYAVKNQVGIDFTGYTAPAFNCSGTIKNFPFNESFETSSPTRSCWTNVYNGGSTNWAAWATGDGGGGNSSSGNVRNTAANGSLNARFLGGANVNTKYVSPIFDLTNVTNPKVTFWYGQRASTTSGSNHRTLRVYYRTSPSGSWQQIGDYTSRQNNWTEVTLDLPNKSATYQIAFEGRSTVSTSSNDRPSVLDNITVFGDETVMENIQDPNYYNPSLSTLDELFSAKNWTKIPNLDLNVKINDSHNKISMIFQTGVESRMDIGSGNQTEGNVRYMCGIFRRLSSQPENMATLIALRADQINNTIGKPNADKTQSIYTLTYTVNDIPANEYVFSTACRRLSLTDGNGSESTSLFSIGNSIGPASANNDFMLDSIMKMDVIELVTVTGL